MDAGAEHGVAREDMGSRGWKLSMLCGGEMALLLVVTSVQSRFPRYG